MKKKALFVLLIITLMISTINVNAEEAAWPKIFTNGEYEYSIEGIILNLYEVSKSDSSHDEGMPITTANFLNDVPTRTIEINADGYTINPEYKERKIGMADGMVIDINLNITKEKLESLLQSELATTDTKKYLVELAVKYKFNEMPEIYTHTYKVNLFKSLINIMLNSGDNLKPINMKEINYQVVNLMTIDKNDETGAKELTVDLNPGRDSEFAINIINYQELFEKAATSSEEVPSYVIMFSNSDNMDSILDSLEEVEEEEKNEQAEKIGQNDEEVVKVEDTALSSQIYLYAASLISLLLGSILVIVTIESKKQKS